MFANDTVLAVYFYVALHSIYAIVSNVFRVKLVLHEVTNIILFQIGVK